MLEPQVETVRYRVSCLPANDPNAYLYTLHVERRGVDPEVWCVTDGAYCYSRTGRRGYERMPSGRTERYKKAYRFDLDTAMELAKRLVVKKKVMGRTVEQYLTWMSERENSSK